MPKNKLIAKYAKETEHSEELVNEVIVSFFNYFKKCMKSPTLPDIRLKNFGVFRPAISRLKQSLTFLERRKVKGIVDEEVYEQRKTMITDYLKDYN